MLRSSAMLLLTSSFSASYRASSPEPSRLTLWMNFLLGNRRYGSAAQRRKKCVMVKEGVALQGMD